MSYNTLPDVTISTVFGTIKKIVWFEVEYNSGNYGTFNVNLFITADRTRDVKIIIFNNGSNQIVYEKTYFKTSNNTSISDSVSITHTPSTMSSVYGIKLE
jgi:hypothetical protein